MKNILNRTISTLLALTLTASFAVMPAFAAEEENVLTAAEGTVAAELIENKTEETSTEETAIEEVVTEKATTEETTTDADAGTVVLPVEDGTETDNMLLSAEEPTEAPVVEEAPVADAALFLTRMEAAIDQYVARNSTDSGWNTTKSTNIEACKVMAQLVLSDGTLTDEQIIKYTERLVGLKTVTEFVALFNEIMDNAGLYNSKVVGATDGSFDRMNLSRWMEMDATAERYYTYSTRRLTVPQLKETYTDAGNGNMTDEQLRQVSRLLEAGYPLDLYGLSETAVGFSGATQAYFTQEVLFMLLGQLPPPDPENSFPYMLALYNYATGTEKLEPIDMVTITFDNKIELKYSDTTKDYRAAVAVHVTGTADKVTIESIPQGVKLLNGNNVELKVGSTFDPAEVLTMVTTGETLITGSLRAGFVSYYVVNNDMKAFSTGKVYRFTRDSSDEAQVYSPMVGYQIKEVKGEAELPNFSLIGPQNPEQFLLTVNYVDVNGKPMTGHSPYTTYVTKGDTYDATEQAGMAIDGYTIESTEGVVSGAMTGDVTITVTYKAIPSTPSEPENPGSGGNNNGSDNGNNGGNNNGGNTDIPTTPERPSEPEQPEIEIPEEEPPLTDLPEIEIPEVETPLAPLPETAPEEPKTDDVIIVDPETPLGSLPQTGTVNVTFYAALGMAALALSLALVTFVVALKKKEN